MTQAAHLLPPERRKPKSRSSWIVTIVATVIGMVGGYLIATEVGSAMKDLGGLVLLGLLVGFVVILWLQILLHEAGHAVAALLAGRLRLHWGGGIKGLGGSAMLMLRDDEPRRAAAWFALAGPLANFGCAALAYIAWRLMPDAAPWIHALLFLTILVGLILGIVNLIPLQVQGWTTDGYDLRELVRGSPLARVRLHQQQIAMAAMAGVRPRDWRGAMDPVDPDRVLPRNHGRLWKSLELPIVPGDPSPKRSRARSAIAVSSMRPATRARMARRRRIAFRPSCTETCTSRCMVRWRRSPRPSRLASACSRSPEEVSLPGAMGEGANQGTRR